MQRNHLIFRLLLALCALAGFTALPVLARQEATTAATDDSRWDSRFGLPGVGYGITAVAVGPDGSVYAAGDFDEAAGLPAGNIARWDGSRWHTLGSGVQGEVRAVAVGDDGAVYVGGSFAQAGDALANGIAVWRNGAWSAVGDGSGPNSGGFAGTISALAFSNGTLYAGGRFDRMDNVEANSIAAWDGTRWRALGVGLGRALWGEDSLTGGEVMAIQPAPEGIYVGGDFSHAQDASATVEVNHIARWDGTRWHALGSGVDDEQTSWTPISSLALLGGELYAAGEFAHAGDVAANNIARWDGTRWHALGSGVSAGAGCCQRIYGIAALGGALYVGGEFGGAGGKATPFLAKWEGGQWNAVGGGVDGTVRGLAAGGGRLIVAGEFEQAGGLAVSHIAAWDGAAWSALGLGVSRFNIGTLPATTEAVAVDAAGRVFIGGNFNRVGGAPANNIAMWDGSRWHALGAGTDKQVTALLVHGGALYVGGEFTQAGGVAARGIARYDLATGAWSAVGGGVDGIVYDIVTDGSRLYVGGNFNAAGNVEARDVAIWDGASWEALSGAEFFDYYMQDGLPKEAMTATYALALDGDLLYIGGYFVRLKTGPGLDDQTPVFHVVAYDLATQDWYLLGQGTPGVGGSSDWGLTSVYDLAVVGDQLYLAGNFTTAGGVTVNHIARYNPVTNSFSALGGGLGGGKAPRAHSLLAAGGALYVGGSFAAAGGAAGAINIARYDLATGRWSALGSGVGDGISPSVEAMAADADGLYVVGSFLSAGGKPATGFARWGEPISSGHLTAAGGVIESDDGVRLSFPAGAVSGPTTVTYSARRSPVRPVPAGSAAVRSFRITAQGAGGQSLSHVAQPYTLQVSFTEEQLRAAGIKDAASLSLARWDGKAWQPLPPCQGCMVSAASGTVTVRTDQLGEFALVGPSSRSVVYLPAVRR